MGGNGFMCINVVFSACEKLCANLQSSLLWYKMLTETANICPYSPCAPSLQSHQHWWMRYRAHKNRAEKCSQTPLS